MDIQGEYQGHEADRGFVYRYRCPRCLRSFLETSPSLSEPTICHACLTGGRGQRKRSPKGRLRHDL